MKIAIIGAGISGLTAAYELSKSGQHEITVLEAADRIGGHTATIDVDYQGEHYAIDTGFIVYNDWTYPRFIQLLKELGVASQETEMSFSVRCDNTGVEYGGNNLNSLFAQRLNVLKPSFLKMVSDILRFNKQAIADLESGKIPEGQTLGEYLKNNNYSQGFIHQYLVPMGCAIWSASTQVMLDFPLLFFVRFFKNHGLLSVNDRPQWRVIKGGSREYLSPLVEKIQGEIEVGVTIESVIRSDQGVQIKEADGSLREFDQVIFACHSDQALAMLADKSGLEDEILGAIAYQDNDVVLHTDISMLPNKRLAWSSWNYRLHQRQQERAVLTYNMNILQGLDSNTTFCVTLNDSEAIDSDQIIGRYRYAHPVFTLDAIRAQGRWSEINGTQNTWFCGAYWANGFHEDGVVSAQRVASAIDQLQTSA